MNKVKNETIHEDVKNNNYVEEDMEQVTINVIKILLEKKVPLEDIQHISGKSIEEIHKIGELID